MTRAGLILIQEQNIALIERHRNGQHYFILPGGQVEKNESLHQALIREAMEELGLVVEPQALVAVVAFHDKPQYYYRVKIMGGVFGNGNGPEMLGYYPPEHGTYQAMWMAVKNLRQVDLRPTPLVPIIEAACFGDWPQQPVYVYECDHE